MRSRSSSLPTPRINVESKWVTVAGGASTLEEESRKTSDTESTRHPITLPPKAKTTLRVILSACLGAKPKRLRMSMKGMTLPRRFSTPATKGGALGSFPKSQALADVHDDPGHALIMPGGVRIPFLHRLGQGADARMQHMLQPLTNCGVSLGPAAYGILQRAVAGQKLVPQADQVLESDDADQGFGINVKYFCHVQSLLPPT